ncbi:MAG: ABC transporter ATP-binding protein [Bacillota bacterium]|jgi:ABC-2 type transport system ATP-binding protein|nr:ABC transporter ATP-binding protein [Bacillota bacterium]NLU55109.1 ABC transporter ATP-binding protein [Bacillota bacterium]HOA90779.1 ABC transporter ATP-binding protein [Bacillota bacterium]HOJ47007.1 ABC transporter ATP-binding protein [Bacillota bacterium]HOP54959.1 ABC transporter ATP-binding protein [Bacillota bacterium]
MIESRELTKKFGNVTAVNSVSFDVKEGELFAFLGPNGAGKTTTIKMLSGLLIPTSGAAFIDGVSVIDNPVEAKKRIGFVPDQPNVYDKLTLREFLDFVISIYRVDRKKAQETAEEYLEIFDLADRQDELLEGYSHGMRQKANIIAALIHEPKVMFLDEPTVGLDPRSARLIKDILRKLTAEGRTIFMSTHILEIAEEMADRVGIINKGSLKFIGTVEELRKAQGKDGSLEDLFLELTASEEDKELISQLRG